MKVRAGGGAPAGAGRTALELQRSFNSINSPFHSAPTQWLIGEPGVAPSRLPPDARPGTSLLPLMRIGLSPISINSSRNRFGYNDPANTSRRRNE